MASKTAADKYRDSLKEVEAKADEKARAASRAKIEARQRKARFAKLQAESKLRLDRIHGSWLGGNEDVSAEEYMRLEAETYRAETLTKGAELAIRRTNKLSSVTDSLVAQWVAENGLDHALPGGVNVFFTHGDPNDLPTPPPSLYPLATVVQVTDSEHTADGQSSGRVVLVYQRQTFAQELRIDQWNPYSSGSPRSRRITSAGGIKQQTLDDGHVSDSITLEVKDVTLAKPIISAEHGIDPKLGQKVVSALSYSLATVLGKASFTDTFKEEPSGRRWAKNGDRGARMEEVGEAVMSREGNSVTLMVEVRPLVVQIDRYGQITRPDPNGLWADYNADVLRRAMTQDLVGRVVTGAGVIKSSEATDHETYRLSLGFELAEAKVDPELVKADEQLEDAMDELSVAFDTDD